MASTQTDLHLIQQTLQGKRESFGILVSRYFSLVYGIALSYTGNAGDAEDISQESFLRAYRSLDTLRDADKFRAWLARIARNECHTWRARNPRREVGVEVRAHDEPAVSPEHERQELFDFLWKEIRCLDEASREILVLYYFHGRNTRDLATQLDISPDAAEKRLQRARQQLGERMSDHLDEALKPHLPSRDKAQRTAQAVLAVPVVWNAAQIAPLAGAGAAASGVWPLSAYVLLAAVAALSGLTWFTFTRTELGQGAADSSIRQQAPRGTEAAENGDAVTPGAQTPETGADETHAGKNGGSDTPPYLTVVVTEKNDPSSPIAGVTVKLISMTHESVTAKTDKQGIARFDEWVLGDLGVLLQHRGHLNARSTHTLGQAGTTLHLEMVPGLLVAGQVVDAQTREPIPDFVLDFLEGDPVEVHDPEGRFTFGNMSTLLSLAAHAEGYAWAFLEIEPGVDTSDLTIALQRPQIVRGRVRDTSGSPLAGVQVGVARQLAFDKDRGTLHEVAQTDSDGLFQFAQVDPRDDHAVLEHENYVVVTTAIPNRPPAWIDVEMRRTCGLRGVIRLAGKPVQGAKVFGNSWDSNVAETGATGSYALEGLTPGEKTVVAELPRHATESGPNQTAGKGISLEEGQQATLDFDFEPATSRISGRVTVRGATSTDYAVRLHSEHSGTSGIQRRYVTVSPGDEFWLEDVPSGRTELAVEVDFADGPELFQLVSFDVPPLTEVRQDFEFAPSAAIVVHVQGIPSGYQADVQLYGEGTSGEGESCRTYRSLVSDGDASFQPLFAGIYTTALRFSSLTRQPIGGIINRRTRRPQGWHSQSPREVAGMPLYMLDERFSPDAIATVEVAENSIAEVTLIASE
ncbi:MAG: sigma-70 family RNA polymerase sigma factor [Candidatus Hydrogenedentes bacterium]|nr:sigma-70 family RNA polymerase sigma factor [Candidatus Hydrogenedentota bacterium]